MLLPDEQIEQTIEHKKHLPFRLEDWIRSFILIGFMIAGTASIVSDGFISIGTFLLSAGLYFATVPLYLRWRRIQYIEYILTNRRLIIFDKKKNEIRFSFDLNEFPEMTLNENAYNSGYIIIGEAEPFLVSDRRPFTKWGVNVKDHKIVLENIPHVRKAYDLILSRIKNKETQATG